MSSVPMFLMFDRGHLIPAAGVQRVGGSTVKITANALVVLLFCFSFVATAGCGTDSNERRTDLLTETVIEPGADDSADMETGARVLFPAGTFTENTIILISDQLTGEEIDAALFPEGAQTILAGLVLNSPVDSIFRKNVTFTWALLNTVEAGSAYGIYRFNEYYEKPEEAWVEIQGLTAVVDATGKLAYSLMPSSGVAGYSGSFALFVEKTAETPPNRPPEIGVDGIASDPATYVVDTSVKFSCAVSDPDGDALAISWDDGDPDHGTFSNEAFADGVASADWVSDAPGDFVVRVTVEDGSGVSVSRVLNIVVS